MICKNCGHGINRISKKYKKFEYFSKWKHSIETAKLVVDNNAIEHNFFVCCIECKSCGKSRGCSEPVKEVKK